MKSRHDRPPLIRQQTRNDPGIQPFPIGHNRFTPLQSGAKASVEELVAATHWLIAFCGKVIDPYVDRLHHIRTVPQEDLSNHVFLTQYA